MRKDSVAYAPKATASGALLVATILVGLFIASPVLAEVYSFVGDDGTPHFSDQPTDPRFRLVPYDEQRHLRLKKEPVQVVTYAYSRRYAKEISAVAKVNRLDAALLHAVVETESGYNPRAISPKGAQGLMQLMPGTARQYGVGDPFDVAQNLHGGALLLRDLLDQFSENKELALAAYNAGAGSVLSHGRRIPPYPETIRYVTTVLQRYERQRGSP